MASRIYRAPELIFLERQYDSAIDVWGLGCIMAELMVSSKPNAKHKTAEHQSKRDRYIFPADSCYPLSPDARYGKDTSITESDISLSPNDMVFRIVNELNPDKADVAFLTRAHSRYYQK